VNSISNLISQTGYINADFNDAKSVMQNAGTALMGIGRASGENRAEEAARAATTSPLLDMSIEGAKGVLYNIVGADLTLTEISLVSELIREAVDPSANIKFGAQIDPNAGDELTITIVATGFSDQPYTKRQSEINVGGTSRIRTFGFEPENKVNNAEIVKESEDEEESFESFDAVDAMPVDSFDNGNDSFTDSEKLKDIPTDDPLDIPAFMRKKK